MKKFASILLTLALVLALCVPAMAKEELPVVRLGKLSRLALSEEEMDASQDANREQFPILGEQRIENVFYDSMADMLMALDAGQIDGIEADEPTVQYVLSRNDGYAENHPQVEMMLEYSLCFLDSNAALCDSFNNAITAMREDGTLDALAEQYIDGAISGAEPEAVAFPSFEGADGITVAVTGDLPPMDYVTDDGSPAGFNTAVLAEIAKRLDLNVELMQINSGARALALSSGRADAVFWVMRNTYFSAESAAAGVPLDSLDIPENTLTSAPYYSAPMCFLAPKAE